MSCPNTLVRRSQRKKCWDRISNLPDCVLSRILSLLPTKDAVRTSVLSKDWEYKWTSICNIDINDEDQFLKKKKNKSTKTSFVKFVERMLFLTEDVKSFHLECWEEHGASRMTALIFSALKYNLRSLRVMSREAGIIMPGKLLNCHFLEKLMLWLPCILNVPKKVYFGSLTSLCLYGVDIVNEASNDDPVMFEFPVLVELSLSKCKWLNMKYVEIHTPRMTSFECETPVHTVLNDYSIKITGGSIEKLQSRGGFPEHIVLSSGSSVVSAALENICEREDFYLLGENRLQIQELLRELSNVEDLKLSSVFLHAIALSKLVGYSLPRFNNLEELVIEGNARASFELLHAAPFLKRLKLSLRYFADFNYDTEECVPSCLQSHLEEVSIRCSLERRTELDLVKYFLENGAKLKELDISDGRLYSMSKDEVAKEISTFSKASKCVTVSFSDWSFV